MLEVREGEGGGGNSRPFRTYLSRQGQVSGAVFPAVRCRLSRASNRICMGFTPVALHVCKVRSCDSILRISRRCSREIGFVFDDVEL